MASSYNELFGLGSHSDDASSEGFWPLQETTGTTASDESSNARNATYAGMGSNPVTATGPNSYLVSSVDFSPTTYADPSIVWDRNADFTVCCWVEMASVLNTALFGHTARIGANDRLIALCRWSDNNIYFDTGGTGVGQRLTVSNSSTGWQFVTFRINRSSGFDVRLNKSTIVSYSGTPGLPTSDRNFYIGGAYNPTDDNLRYGHHGPVAGFGLFSRSITDSESDEAQDGPELVNTTAPAVTGTETVGQTLSCTTGTWVLPSPFSSGTNGTATYAYQWTRSDDGSGSGEADIGGATSSTYTLVAGDSGKYIRCRVRASNSGGFDSSADTNSNFTGAIGGGGGGFQPAWAIGATQVAGVAV